MDYIPSVRIVSQGDMHLLIFESSMGQTVFDDVIVDARFVINLSMSIASSVGAGWQNSQQIKNKAGKNIVIDFLPQVEGLLLQYQILGESSSFTIIGTFDPSHLAVDFSRALLSVAEKIDEDEHVGTMSMTLAALAAVSAQ